jgi:hypothetical protein
VAGVTVALELSESPDRAITPAVAAATTSRVMRISRNRRVLVRIRTGTWAMLDI